jgi:TolB-like protein/Tfp pilus assembly protein PilF
VSGERTGSASDVTQREFVGGQRLLGRYTLIRILGRGGMGIVWLAHDEELERDVALKFLPDLITHDAAVLSDLKRETRRCLELTHKNIVRIYDFVHDEHSGCISMEYIDGDTLSKLRCDKERKVFEPPELSDWMSQLCDALDYAHNYAHIIHRDLKPANLMVNQRGQLKVSDFGIARSLGDSMSLITMAGGRSGTLAYMSPQQLEGERGSHLDDIYSLGATVYDLLTSKPPFYVGNIDRQIREKIPPSMSERRKEFDIEGEPIPAVWEEVVAGCLAKDPGRRPQSVTEIARQLQMPSPEARPPPVRSFFERKKKRVLALALAGVGVIVSAIAGFFLLSRGAAHKIDKSIAVLPFENLSEEKGNAYFAEGIKDEILTKLATVRDLKVISRTSTAKYQSKPDNLKTVAQELGVSTILEGAVQKVGDKVRVNVQLIDARADTHLWAKSYDRDFKDVLAVESDVSQEIADALQANLSPSESHALASARTRDAEAYDLFLRGEYELHQAESSLIAGAALDRADGFYRQALARDSNFAEAAAELARSRLRRHFQVSLLAPAELEEVKSLIDRALALAPNSPEAHLALGLFFYWGHRQYENALTEFNRTLELQPNSALARQYCAYVYRRRGEWERSLADLQRAQELDPRDATIPVSIGETYTKFRLWKDAERAALRALAIDPHNAVAAVILFMTRLNATGDVESARRALDDFPEATKIGGPPTGFNAFGGVTGIIAGWPVSLHVLHRRFTDAFQAFEKQVPKNDDEHLKQLAGRAALRVLAGQTEAAKSAGEEALPLLEARFRERPDDTFAITELSWVYLALGRDADALRLSRQAADTISIEKDAMVGQSFQVGLAQIEARAGAPEEAIKRLRRLLSIPAGWDVSIARLKIDPVWDPIRNRPDFQQLLSGPEQIGPGTQVGPAAAGSPEPATIPEKSIAVLPFENLSRDPDNAFFTDGVQDEILADLAKIADLKVISRTSVMLYKSGNPRNLREIGQQLGVAHVLEGSVQRAGNRVRVMAQLVDARTDAHLWAQIYDRDLADVFAIQSEIAKTIADQLQARLSPAEKAAIEQRPTADLAAFDLYVRATALIDAVPGGSWTAKEKLLQAVNFLDQAIDHDPAFLLAYCKLAGAHDFVYLLGLDHTPGRLTLADTAVKNALRLGPDSGDAHLASAQHLYSNLDYDGARAEIGVAHRTLPNNPRIFELSGYIDRRQGRWEESTRNFERSLDLDPRNVPTLQNVARNYISLRDYAKADAAFDRVLAFKPNDTDARLWRAIVDMDWKADTRSWHALVETILKDNPGSAESIAPYWLYLAFCEHDSVAAARALAVFGNKTPGADAVVFSRAYFEGLLARMKGDVAAAHAAFTEARAAQEQIVQAQPDYGPALCVLGLIDAGLGRKEDALREGRRAIELLPVTKDFINGARMIEFFAVIAAWVGEKDLACEQLAIATRLPSTLSYGQLKLHPNWDPLRGDPRFEKIVASLAPKETAPNNR